MAAIPFNELEIDRVFQMEFSSFEQMLTDYENAGVPRREIDDLRTGYLRNLELEERGDKDAAAEERANLALAVGTSTTLAAPFLGAWALDMFKTDPTGASPEVLQELQAINQVLSGQGTSAASQGAGAVANTPSLSGALGGGVPQVDPSLPGGLPGLAPEAGTPITGIEAASQSTGPLASLFGPSTGTVGLNSLGTALPAAAVAAYLGPSYMEHGGNILSGSGNTEDYTSAALLSNPITAWAEPILGDEISGLFSGSPHPERADRDAARGYLAENTGLFSPGTNWTVNRGDFGGYDLGSGSQPSYNIDWDLKGVDDLVGAIQPLTFGLPGSDDKLRSDITGDLFNASYSNKDPLGQVAGLYQQYNQNFDDPLSARNEIGSNIWRNFDAGSLNEQQRDAALAQNDLLYGVDNPNASEEDRRRQQSNQLFGSALF